MERIVHAEARTMILGRSIVALLIALSLSAPASAGIFSRKPKGNPAEQVPTLIMQLKIDKEDSHRANAAEELRNHDPKAFPEIMTVLVDALIKDTSASVRAESASTIAKLRPISQQAGFALEQAASNDPAMRVRMAARQALWQYHLVGYRSGKPDESAQVNNNNSVAPQSNTTTRQFVTKNVRTGQFETAEPPLAGSETVTTLKPQSPPLQEVPAPKLLTPPPTKPKGKPAKNDPKSKEPEGPILTPPQ
jgi:hypothetical protein